MFLSATRPTRCLLVEDSPADADLARYVLQAAHADLELCVVEDGAGSARASAQPG
jgi:hypothetical protein